MEMTHDELIARTVPAAAAVVLEDHDAVCSRRDRQRSLQRFQALPSGGRLLRSGTDLSQVFPNVHQASKPFVLALVKDATNLIAQWRFDLTTLVTGKRPHAVRPAFDSADFRADNPVAFQSPSNVARCRFARGKQKRT